MLRLRLPPRCSEPTPQGPNCRIRLPKTNKKVANVQKKRRQQLKQVINDVTDIANKEIDRFRELANDLLSDPKDSPIVTETVEVSEPESQE